MGIDLGRYLQLYFDENEAYLLTLDQLLQAWTEQSPASEDIHLAIRAAHSIKGSSGAFGFVEVVELAQALEWVLRQAEQQKIWMGTDRLAQCTEAVAGLQQLLVLRRQGMAGDAAFVAAMSERLAECLADSSTTGA